MLITITSTIQLEKCFMPQKDFKNRIRKTACAKFQTGKCYIKETHTNITACLPFRVHRIKKDHVRFIKQGYGNLSKIRIYTISEKVKK
ncbi:hypothetical protein HanPSC8_Chr07g0306381 [Helianthus annuus]|nr:hypothetical protein HanPSC8_Chr07g0306381 [Helianthus annuus]